MSRRRESGGRQGEGGFTLVETVVAMILVSAVVLPASLWLYRTRTNHAAQERFRAVQFLEDRMNRAILLRKAPALAEQAPGQPPCRVEIRMEDQGGDRTLVGTAEDARGRKLADMEAVLFERDIR